MPSFEDVHAISALVYRYAELIDAGDLDALAAMFEHATWGAGTRTERLHGTEQVRRGYGGVILYEEGTPRTKHVITNLAVDVADGATRATARSYFTVLQATEGLTLQPIIAGRYDDEFEKVDGTWRFRERIIHPDLHGDLSKHMRGPTR
ncbi:MAG TPA: nuclear transport factor 2 family protein [Acidimicrobiales bacterium]